MRTRNRLFLTVLFSVFGLGACMMAAADMGATQGGGMGATQGGVQDMKMARELIDSGRVPPPEALIVEGMFSEHDLPLDGPACERALCLRSALGWAPNRNDEASGWLQVGMSSNIDPDTFQRPSLTVIATVDVSGSMGWTYDESEVSPGTLARRLLKAIVPKLGAADHIAIVTYGSAINVPLALTRGDEQQRIMAAVDGLHEAGSTNMEGGIRKAYELANEARGLSDARRVILFTDAQPNVGATGDSEFETMVQQGAQDGVSMTVMGLGLGLGVQLMDAMSHLRGANAFSLFDHDDVPALLDESWPWFVSPIAYDLSVKLAPTAEFTLADSYGFPSGPNAEGHIDMSVSTVFLSKKRGALLLRLAPAQEATLDELVVSGELAYADLDGNRVTDAVHRAWSGGDPNASGQAFEQRGVGRTVSLALLVSGMREAAGLYAGSRDASIAVMRKAHERFAADATALGDADLQPEVELARRMLELMEQGAEQGDMYPR